MECDKKHLSKLWNFYEKKKGEKIHIILIPALNIDIPARKLMSSMTRRANEMLNPTVKL